MSGDEEVLVSDDDVAKKQNAVAKLLNVVAYGAAEVSRTPEDSGLRLMLARCMELLRRAETELDEAAKAARGSDRSAAE